MIDYHGEKLTLPTQGEILRIKGVLILKRNATRDYLDDELYPQLNRVKAACIHMALVLFDKLPDSR